MVVSDIQFGKHESTCEGLMWTIIFSAILFFLVEVKRMLVFGHCVSIGLINMKFDGET
jgi:hypothetical protein